MSSLIALILGVLISQQPVLTVTGQTAYRCVYSVSGRTVVVMSDGLCPPTQDFR